MKARDGPKQQKQIANPKGPMHIQNLASNKLTCLVFRVAYKVKYEPPGKAPPLTREFVLGRAPFFLTFSEVAPGCILDREVEFALTMHKELSVINDLLWDANEHRSTLEDLHITMRMTLSNGEDLAAEQAAEEVERQHIQREIQKMKGLGAGPPGAKADDGMEGKMDAWVAQLVHEKRILQG